MKLFSLLIQYITVTLPAYLFITPEANLQAWEEQQENEWTERGRQREVQGGKEGVKAVQRLKKRNKCAFASIFGCTFASIYQSKS